MEPERNRGRGRGVREEPLAQGMAEGDGEEALPLPEVGRQERGGGGIGGLECLDDHLLQGCVEELAVRVESASFNAGGQHR